MLKRTVLIEKSPRQITFLIYHSDEKREFTCFVRTCIDLREIAWSILTLPKEEKIITILLEKLYKEKANPEDFFLICRLNSEKEIFVEGDIIHKMYVKP